MPSGPAGCTSLSSYKRLGAGGGAARENGTERDAGSEAPVRLGSAPAHRQARRQARRRASWRRYWGGRIGDAGAMETPSAAKAAEWEVNLEQKEQDQRSVEEGRGKAKRAKGICQSTNLSRLGRLPNEPEGQLPARNIACKAEESSRRRAEVKECYVPSIVPGKQSSCSSSPCRRGRCPEHNPGPGERLSVSQGDQASNPPLPMTFCSTLKTADSGRTGFYQCEEVVWKPTYDVFHKHEDYMQSQFMIYQETIEKDKKMYHDYICQYKEVLKQYQLKYSETPFSREYYKKKTEHEEIQNRVMACSEQLKMNETVFVEFLVPAPFPSLTKWTLHMVNMRRKTQEILKLVSNFTKNSSELKKEVDEVEMEINYLNQQITRLYETKKLSETLEEKTSTIEKRKELKERICETDEHVLVLNKNHPNSQLFLPYESQKIVRQIKMHSSGLRVTGTVFNDSTVNNPLKYSQVPAIKISQNFMQFRLLTPQKQPNSNQWCEKEDTDAECGDKWTVRQLRETKCSSNAAYSEPFEKSVENKNKEVKERAEDFPKTPEIPLTVRTSEAVKTPESLEKLQFHKTPSFEINRDRNTVLGGQTQKESPGFSFLLSYTSRSPGLNLFDSSVFDSETSSDQFNEHCSATNINPLSSQQEIGNLFEKSEDGFTFSFPPDSSTHTFVSGKDDFSFPFPFDQDQNVTHSSAVKDFSSSSQNTTQFTFF
ncbi:PREDICTED: protein SIX6OS1 [Chrysochloris asiatica]|uniref:Protein SIX6OS1 n=1 Tax=Chrysochloris asiatica TaxID=185453 RepID=A0A9B0TGV3_CHRAS|nr:PREDICTED: protein SIX6OS1 [Chrysochloris asiatica]